MARRRITLAVVVMAAACATPPAAAPATDPPATAPAASAGATALPPGALRFTIVAPRSIATIRVREQIAAVPAPGDAVLTTTAFSGTLVLLPDGTFSSGSLIAAELDALDSDSDLRDEWIKINTLETRRYPRAELAPHRLGGVPLPLPASGEWSGTIDGTMRIHGVERALSWPITISRGGGEVRARGATAFRFGDYGMAVPANRLILSVVDEVRLEIDVVARE